MSVRERLSGAFKDQSELDLTEGGIGWPLFYLSLPIVVTNLLQTAYNLADTFWLGQYSTNALAAISFAFPVVFLLFGLGMGLSVAGSVLVAQHTGAGEQREAEYAASQTVTFSVVASLLLGIVGFLVARDFLAFLGASPDVLPMATEYMEIIAFGMVPMFGFWVFVALMRGYGDTVTPMVVMFGSVVLNIFLDPFLIFGFTANPLFEMLSLGSLQTTLFEATGFTGLGMAGAAVATVAARLLAMVVGLALMFEGSRGVRIRLSQMRPDLGYFRKMIEIGVPASVEVTGRALSVNLILVIVGLFPTTVVAGYGIAVRVFSVIFLPAIAVARGVETMSGQNIGANEPDRAAATNHFAARVMFVVLTAMGVFVWLAATPVVAVFTDNPDVISVGVTFLRYVAPTFGFIGVMRAYTGGFRGAGKTLTAAALSFLMLWVVRLPIAWVGATELGSNGIWVAFAVSNVVGGLAALFWFTRGTWRDVDLTEDEVAVTLTDD